MQCQLQLAKSSKPIVSDASILTIRTIFWTMLVEELHECLAKPCLNISFNVRARNVKIHNDIHVISLFPLQYEFNLGEVAVNVLAPQYFIRSVYASTRSIH